jgi:phage terminase large subunit
MSEVTLDTLIRWRRDPVSFVVDNFGITPDIWQAEALEALGGEDKPRRRVAMKACTGPGKSAALAWAGWHRLACFAGRGEHPKGAALSGEGRDNLADNLWAELSKWQQRSKFLMAAFTWHKERIVCNDHHETWFLSARSYPNDADTEAIGRSLSGLHSQFPFVLLDETGAMPVAVGQKAEQIFTGGVHDGLVMMAGNPTNTDGLLYNVCTIGREQWVIITITADPDDPRRTPRVDIEHAREMIAKYGRENPWVMATILGQFPASGLNTLLGVDEVELAMRRNITPDKYEFSQKRLGVDVARFGDDKTVIFPRQGLQAFKPVEMRNARSNEIAARIMSAKLKWDSEIECVDDTGGYGAGVIDALLQGGASPLSVHFSGKAIDARYLNKRAEMWFQLAEWVKRGGGLPQMPELVGELTTPTYTFRNGKFQIEEKDQIKDRLGRSPDLADALALTFALPEMPNQIRLPGVDLGYGKIKYEYDPLKGAE